MANNKSSHQEIKALTEERDHLTQFLEESTLKLEKKTREFALLTRIGDIIKHTFDVNAICRNFANIIIEETNAENCSLLLKDHTSGNLLLKVACGTLYKEPTFFEDLTQSSVIFKIGEGVAGMVALEHESILINDVNNDSRFDHSRKSNVLIGSLLCCPLIWQNQLLGVINMSSSQTHAFAHDDLQTISMFSTFVSSILCNATMYNELAITQEQFKAEAEERRRVEETLRETKDHLNNIIESSIDCIMVSDRTGYITRVNKYFLDLLGYEAEEAIGKHVMECTPMIEEGTYECSTGEVLKIGKEFVNEANSIIAELVNKGRVTNWEAYYLRKDKRLVPVEQNIVCLYDKSGERTGAVAVIRDITKRKKAERAIREAKEFLENIFKTSADGIIITDGQGIITMVNVSTERILGYDRDDLIGQSTSVLNPDGKQYADHSSTYLEQLFEKGSVTAFEFTWLKKDGGLVDVEVNTALLKDSDNNITGAVTSIRDITERKHHREALQKAYDEMELRVQERTIALKRSNEQLKREIIERELVERKLFEAKEFAEYANKAKSEFLANMSHEFRTPLNHIIGFTELVVDKNFGDLNETQEEYLHDVLDSSKHLLSLISDILDLSKVEAGKMYLEPSPVDLKLLLEHSLIMFKEKTFKHGIELAADMDHIPDTITADERKLKQILYNLLSNAVKFTPDGGKVCLKARMVDCIVQDAKRWGDPEGLQIISADSGTGKVENSSCGKCVEISVSDTGIGIKRKDLERIFKPFEQADGSSTRRYQGTGLGLSLTKRLVELHGGKIWVESEGEGLGATFRFTIPV